MKIKNVIPLISIAILLLLSSCRNQEMPIPEEVQQLGYIYNFNADDMKFDFDVIEWINSSDTERIKELNLDPDNDMPNGFYIYNPNLSKRAYELSNNTFYEIIDWEQNGELTVIDIDGFANHINRFDENKILCWITTNKGSIIRISERYVP